MTDRLRTTLVGIYLATVLVGGAIATFIAVKHW